MSNNESNCAIDSRIEDQEDILFRDIIVLLVLDACIVINGAVDLRPLHLDPNNTRTIPSMGIGRNRITIVDFFVLDTSPCTVANGLSRRRKEKGVSGSTKQCAATNSVMVLWRWDDQVHRDIFSGWKRSSRHTAVMSAARCVSRNGAVRTSRLYRLGELQGRHGFLL